MRKRAERPIEEAAIRGMTVDGRGVADIEGKRVFVDAALTGERVRFQRARKRRNYDEAELVEVLSAAPSRQEARCEVFGVCGGCRLQHLEGSAQLGLKQQSLLEALDRIGKVTPERVLSPLVGEQFGYRRRARLGVKYVEKKGRLLIGFRERRKPYIADMGHCETLIPELASLLPKLTELIADLSVCRSTPQVELSADDSTAALIFRVLEAPTERDLEKLAEFGRKNQVQVWLQTGGPATVAPLNNVAYEPLRYALPDYGLQLEYGPLDFVQVNQGVNQLMIRQALDLLDPQPSERILDLFCGIGNFTLPLARTGAHVTGVELSPEMVSKALQNAALNNLSNANFHAADLTTMDADAAWVGSYDTVVLDPPRAGAAEAIDFVVATGAQRILYVSCHPGSLARDAGVLVHEHGFQLKAAGAMDMFPQTSHVEAMALFERELE